MVFPILPPSLATFSWLRENRSTAIRRAHAAYRERGDDAEAYGGEDGKSCGHDVKKLDCREVVPCPLTIESNHSIMLGSGGATVTQIIKGRTMKYLVTTTFAIAFVLGCFVPMQSSQARSEYDEHGQWCGMVGCAGRDDFEERLDNVQAPRIDEVECLDGEDCDTNQFADREDGFGGDSGESGGDFGEGDRAAASTAAE